MARLGKRLSQTDLARLLQLEGVPMERDVISRMEMGDRLVTDYEVVTIAEAPGRARVMAVRERRERPGVKITPGRFSRAKGENVNYKGYHHLKWEDRLKIEGALKTGGKPAEIAEMLGVCVKTIYNEIKRGLCLQQKEGYIFQEEYCAEVAERKYQEHLRAKGPRSNWAGIMLSPTSWSGRS